VDILVAQRGHRLRLPVAAAVQRAGLLGLAMSELELTVQTQAVVYRFLQILPGSQVPFRGLDGGVTEQKLDLLVFPAPRRGTTSRRSAAGRAARATGFPIPGHTS